MPIHLLIHPIRTEHQCIYISLAYLHPSSGNTKYQCACIAIHLPILPVGIQHQCTHIPIHLPILPVGMEQTVFTGNHTPKVFSIMHTVHMVRLITMCTAIPWHLHLWCYLGCYHITSPALLLWSAFCTWSHCLIWILQYYFTP